MTKRTGPVLALIVGVLVGYSSPAASQGMEDALKDSYPTNLTMLGEATKAAISELLLGFNAPTEQTLLIEVSGTHEGDWFVENHLLAQLTGSGYHAYLKEASTPGPSLDQSLETRPDGSGQGRADLPDTASAGDTTLVADSLSTVPLEPDPEPDPEIAESEEEPRPEYVLRFRVVQFEITYPDNFKTSPLGSRKVQRLASVSVMAHLLRGDREDVVWVGSGDVERIDTVPASKLPLLEGPNFPFTQPVLETGNLGSLVEPVLVTGIVAGLIYLFYTNQN
jgi:hypothetical protein